ncbi:MAG: hypothetical protein K8R90_04475 [Candidatus Cloacimonetes bacterium]|nr:hypothetical protein [Candidatus Cloacimonadota bacterium]
MSNKQADIFDVLTIVAKHRTMILIILAIVSVASVAYALFVTQYWTSHAVLRPVDDGGNLMGMGASFLGLGSALLGGGMSYRGEDFLTIMRSRTFSEDVIRQFSLIEHFEIEESDSLVAMERALKKLTRNFRDVYFDEEDGTVHIVILSKDKQMSREIANYYWHELDQYNRHYKITKGRENRIFIEQRLNEVKDEIESLAKQLQSFLEENNTIQLEEQTRQIIGIYAELVTSKVEVDLELEYARQFLSDESMDMSRLLEKQRILSEQIRDMEGQRESEHPKYILALDRFPELQYKYGKLMLEFEVQKKIYEFLYPQFEQARIDELKDTPTIELIDEARLAGRRSKPRRARLCITNFVVALIASIFLAFVVEYVQLNREKAVLFWRLLWRRHR